jgi:hypothetical protein
MRLNPLPLYILFFLFVNAFHLNAQTGIGTATPHSSAKLEVSATNKGFLPPRVTFTSATDATTIASPAVGLLVYNLGSVGLQAGYYYWNGASWATIATATSAGNGVTSMDLVKLYGEAYSSATGKIGNTNGYSFTVPVSGRYLFDFSCAGYASSESFTMNFYVRQGTSNLGSDAQTSFNQAIHSEYNGKVEANLQSGVTYNVFVSSTGIRNIYDYDRVYYKMVAGNLPVTGQTVEYGLARYTGADGAALNNSALVSFDATAAGNLTWSANKFTLKANKTYELESSLAIYASSPSAGRFQIYDYTNSKSLANGLFISQGGSGTNFPNANTPMKSIVTPTTDIQIGIKLEGSYGAAPGIIGNTSILGIYASSNTSYFMVKQIGSSAIVSPWVLSGNDVYNTIGKVGIGTNAPAYSLDVSGTAKITTTPSIITATSVLVKDPATSQISEQPISYITGVAKFIRNTNQSTISNGTTILLNSSSNNTISSYVSLNTSTGVITLQPGTYELNGSVGGLIGSSGFNGDCRVYSVFHNGTAYVGTGGVSETGPSGNWNGMPQNNSNYIITVATGLTAQITLKAASTVNVSTLSESADFSLITGGGGDAGRAWVVIRKYN